MGKKTRYSLDSAACLLNFLESDPKKARPNTIHQPGQMSWDDAVTPMANYAPCVNFDALVATQAVASVFSLVPLLSFQLASYRLRCWRRPLARVHQATRGPPIWAEMDEECLLVMSSNVRHHSE